MAAASPRFPIFAQRLVRAMKDANVKAKDLATHADVYPATVSAWRNGEYMPEGERLSRVAEKLLVSSTWLAGDDAKTTAPGNADAVLALLEVAQEEQRAWLRNFAARLTTAVEQRLAEGPVGGKILREAAPQPWLSNADVDADIHALETVQQKVANAKKASRKKSSG
jgi:transcriptional regulator with XRE-family HTH domain